MPIVDPVIGEDCEHFQTFDREFFEERKKEIPSMPNNCPICKVPIRAYKQSPLWEKITKLMGPSIGEVIIRRDEIDLSIGHVEIHVQ